MSQGEPTNPIPPRTLEINEIPTEDAVTKQIDAVEQQAGRGAEVVKDLCRRIIDVVRDVDRQNDISRYVSTISLICVGPGGFDLQLSLRDNTINPDEVVADVSAILSDAANYHRPLRSIEVRNEQRPTRPDSRNSDQARPEGAT